MRILILAIAITLLSVAFMPVGAVSGAAELHRSDASAKSSQSSAYFDTDDEAFVKKFLKPGSYMRVSDVRPGMEGYGLSVFRGTKIERFNIKVIGVMKRVNKGKDAILVRMSGPAIGKNNVVRGMSGSPIYIDEKLVGAISYGFDFSTEPIAGVTPIVDMLDALARSKDEPRISGRLKLPRSLALSPMAVSSIASEQSTFRKSFTASASPAMVPLISPVSLSGFSARAQEYLRGRFEEIGLSVSEGTGGGVDPNLSAAETREANALKPGSAVGVLLTTGDFESASTGTVTANFDGRIIGFGHPFVEAGQVDFPMASGYILDVLPSLSISFKLSSPVAVLGNVFSDRPWSIGGQVNGKARMVPVNIQVTDSQRQIRKVFSSRVIEHEDLTPELVAACAMSAIDSTYQSSQPYVARVETSVEIDEATPIKRFDCLTNNFGGSSGQSSSFRAFFSDPVSGNIHSIASRILSNRYKRARLKSVDLKINLETGRDLTRIVRVSTDRSVVRPGDNVRVSCLLEPYDGKSYVETIDLNIPRSTPDGDLAIGVSGGSQLEDLRKRMNLVDPPTTSLEQIVRRIQEKPRGDRLFAVLALPDQAIQVDGEVIESPPGHWSKLFFSNRYTQGPSLVNGERRVSKEIPSPIEGAHIVAVKVKRPEPYLEKPRSYAAVSPSSSSKASSAVQVTAQAQKAIDALNRTEEKPKTDAPAGSDSSARGAGLSFLSSTRDETRIRPVQVLTESEDIKGCTRDGVIVDAWGRIFPGFKESALVSIPALRAWSAVWSCGAIYIGATDCIYKWLPGSTQCEEIARFPATVAIPALVADSKGRIYASLAPGGRIVSIAGGQSSEVAKFSEPLVASLAVDDRDGVYAGVTDSGRIYKLTAGGAPTVFADTGAAHVLSLFFDKTTQRLYAGCGEDGDVLSISIDGKVRCEYHSDEHLVTGVCKSKNGDLFISTAGTGRLVRIRPSGETFALGTSEAFYTLFYHAPTDSIFAGDAEGDITQIQEEPLTEQSFFVPVKHTGEEAVVGFCSDGGNKVYAVSSNLPSILGFSVRPESAVFTSAVKDAVRPARWSRLRVYGSFNEVSPELEKSIALETRSGDTLRPDTTWCAWTPALLTDDGFLIKSKDARYFQYRLRWLEKGSFGDGTFPYGRESVIGKVAVTFQPENVRPRFSSVSLSAGTYINDSEEVSIVGSDADGDTLSLTIDDSLDNGKTWSCLKSDLRASKVSKSAKSADQKDEKSKTDGDTKSDKPGSKSEEGGGGGAPEGDSDKPESPAGNEEDNEQPAKGKPGDPDSGNRPDEEDESSSSITFDSRVYLKANEKKSGDNKPGEKNGAKKPTRKDEPKTTERKKNLKKALSTTAPARQPASPKKTGNEAFEQPDKFVWSLLAGSLKEGHHIIRFRLSDAPSNMVHCGEISCYRYVVIDRTKPAITKADVQISDNQKLRLEVITSDSLSPIANATFRLDGEEPRAFAVSDGLADKKEAHLIASGIEVKKGIHKKVEIEVSDQAGNKVTRTLKLPAH